MNSWQVAVQTINSCLAHGVREFVVCAGARNAVLIEVLARAEEQGLVRLWSHFEERAAGFFALGRSSNEYPCAVLTTSGTAVAELLPAVIEAYYQARPLVLLTADRPARFRGTGAPQAIVQPKIFGEYAGSGELSQWDGRSPWHINVELEEEFEPEGSIEFFQGETELSRKGTKPTVAALAQQLNPLRSLVVMVGGLELEDREVVFNFLLDLQVPVVAEGTSGLRELLGSLVLTDSDRVLLKNPPQQILRLGAVPSGRFWRDLENLPEVEVWNITRSGRPGLARECNTIKGEVTLVIRSLGAGAAIEIGDPGGYLSENPRRRAALQELLESEPDSEPAMVHLLSKYAAAMSESVFLGNSMPIREWNEFAQRDEPIVEVRASRGANGIDGQIATWLGVSAEQQNAWCILGDLTALYDISSLSLLKQTENRGRVLVVINNGGGEIFSRVPRLKKMNLRTQELMKNAHQWELKECAKMWGMDYVKIENQDDFDALDVTDNPILVELKPDKNATDRFWAERKNL